MHYGLLLSKNLLNQGKTKKSRRGDGRMSINFVLVFSSFFSLVAL